jgi:predicted Zn-dependent protease
MLIVLAGTCTARAAELDISAATLDSRELFERGRDAFHRAWFERADDLLGETVEVDPEFAVAHAYKAAAEAFLYQDPSETIARARRASNATAGERLMVNALVALAQDTYEGVLGALEALLDSHPEDRYARHALGFTLIDLGRAREGIPVLGSLLADFPEFIAAWNHLGYAYLDLGDLDRAEQCFARFVSEDPDNPAAHDSWADLLTEQLRTDQAIASLTRATLLEPRYSYGMIHLGDVLVIEGSPALARAAYRRSIETAAATPSRFPLIARERIAATFARQIQLEAARSALDDLIAAADAAGEPASALAAIRSQLAIAITDGDSTAGAQSLRAYRERVANLGDRQAELGEPWQLTFFAGWLSAAEGDLAAAEERAGQLEAAAADGDVEALVLAARLYGEISMARLDYASAIEAFEAVGADDPLVAVRLALAYEGDDKPAAAAALYEYAATCPTFDVGCALATALAAPLFELDWSLPGLGLPRQPPPQEPPPEDQDDGSVRI